MIIKKIVMKCVKYALILFGGCCVMLNYFSTIVLAENAKTEVTGLIYELEQGSRYEFSNSENFKETTNSETYGNFFISGEVAGCNDKDQIPVYEVSQGNLEFFYNYGNQLLNNTNLDSWHLVDDHSKQVNQSTLNENILKGTIIVQTSKDRLNWVDVVKLPNAFNETPIRMESIYQTTDVQLINGCYYRVLVAYELRMRTEDGQFWIFDNDQFEHKKIVEVYEFYAYTDTEHTTTTTTNEAHNLGKKTKVTNFDSYTGEEPIVQGDLHYGWDLGNFFVNGYTSKVKETDGTMVFLKNVGDKVTLWFHLNHDINNLNGQNTLSITADDVASDQYFETPTINFGRGTLIIRYTDHNNTKSEPTIYTNYLEANTTVGADTKVQLFEEGDYEVALNYQVTDDQLLDRVGQYRIFFKFSIRNGNSMVFPFDIATGNELTNSSMTENGFRLDLAKSRYLKINLKKEVLAESADGLVEDTRFNGPAKDGAEYTDEGIYNITVTNEYTGQVTLKKIYVGTDKVLKAHMLSGLPIDEINSLVHQGASINEDGMIQLATVGQSTVESKTAQEKMEDGNGKLGEQVDEEKVINSNKTVLLIGVLLSIAIGVTIFVFTKKKPSNTKEDQTVKKDMDIAVKENNPIQTVDGRESIEKDKQMGGTDQ